VAEEVTFTDFVKSIAQSPENTRLKIAKQLKQAGLYKGEVSSKFNNALYDALTEAEKKRVPLASITGPIERLTFIDELASEGQGTGGAQAVTSRTISEPTELFDDIDAVTREYLGRELPDAAKKKLAQKYIAKQKSGALDVTTSYSGDGSFRQTTGGGMAPQQFFIEQISNSDEGRANKVLQGYDLLLRSLGGLR
jgi:hypothetical protein